MEIILHCNDDIAKRMLCDALTQCEYECSIEVSEGDNAYIICRISGGREQRIDLKPPIRIGFILDQIRKIERNVFLSYPEEIQIGGGLFYPHDMLFHSGNTEITLTEKESSLLVTIWAAEDHTVSRDMLLEKIWGYRAGLDTHTLETHIYRLRQKIETDPADPRLLLTVEDGYRLAI